MDKSTQTLDERITKVAPLEYGRVVIETSANKRYFSDLNDLNKVHCYPPKDQWDSVSIDQDAIDLIWSTRFEVHIHQVIDRAYKTEPTSQAS